MEQQERPGSKRPAERGLLYDGQRERREASDPSRVSLDAIPEIRAILLETMSAPRAEVRRCNSWILREYPGLTRRDIYDARRRLRDDRGLGNRRHSEWSEGEIGAFIAGYARGPGGARESRKQLSNEHPDWNRHVLDAMAAKLGLARRTPQRGPWRAEEDRTLVWDAEEKSLSQIAARLGRSPAAVRKRLCLNGAKGRVRFPRRYSLRQVARLLGISHTTVRRWAVVQMVPVARQNGQQGAGSVTKAGLAAFCRAHPELVNRRKCSPEVFSWLPKSGDEAGLDRSRAHLLNRSECPRCGRAFQGNGYYAHAKRCQGEPQSTGSNVYASTAAVQLASEGQRDRRPLARRVATQVQ